MSGLEKITNSIIKKAEVQADKIISDAKIKSDELIRKSIEYRQELKEENEKKIKEEREKLINKAAADEKRSIKNSELISKNKIIEQILNGAEIKIKNMNNQEYQEVLEKLFKNLSDDLSGKVYFSAQDKERIDKEFRKNFTKRNKNLVIGENFSTQISSGFIIRNDKIDINCSFEALFMEKQGELFDYINSLIHF